MGSRAAALVLAALALGALAACASSRPSPAPSASSPPRARCLADPHETGSRPLFFLFCVEAP